LALVFVVLLGGALPVAVPSSVGADTGDLEVCPPAPEGFARCLAVVHTGPTASGVETARIPVAGITPEQLKEAYGFPMRDRVGAGQTVVITTAFHAPTLEHDLAVFSSRFRLPQCTVDAGCLKVVNQAGGSSYPAVDAGWALETSMDVEWVHAVAPGAAVVVVEATTNSFSNLFAAIDQASTRGHYISNSWGVPQAPVQGVFDHHFTDPGAIDDTFFFGSGDAGTPGIYPSASPYVVSVGGTTLKLRPDGTFKTETGWSGSGGGCSPYSNAAAAQIAFREYARTGCSTTARQARAFPDVSALGDPSTGAAVYDSTPLAGRSGWFVMGGTSLSGPIIAARAAGVGARITPAYLYGNNIAFRDIKVGNNGLSCRQGFDLVTGRGSWTG
jgi:subtilase family serine protease